ncbi:MAG TPA: hypothetical protein VFA07_03655 [Chthonomonadaceae bacterium]|nr:hypothetical protein [Chthonomonadaceae bacterium]
MKWVFADTFYWLALANPADQWHTITLEAKQRLGPVRLVTTEEVLTEFLAALSGLGEFYRSKSHALVQQILVDPDILVLPQSHDSFIAGLELYGSRLDKSYSLTDCISMNTCRTEGITDVLTNDHHFTQEGFHILITR